MSIKPASVWADTYEKKLQEVYKNVKTAADGSIAAIKMWQEWVNENGTGIQCIPPLTVPPPIPMYGTTNQASFSPLLFETAKSSPQVAQILATAWQAWASAIIWVPPIPAPPFSAITTVVIDPSSLATGYASLYSGLLSELGVTPKDEAGVKLKYQNLGTLFFTATSMLRVMFTGLALVGTPPPPLVIMVPVM